MRAQDSAVYRKWPAALAYHCIYRCFLINCVFYFPALNKKECLRRPRKAGPRKTTQSGSQDNLVGGISMPTKLTQLRYSGYSAEFLDRVEPNGNIPGKNGTSIAGNLGAFAKKRFDQKIPQFTTASRAKTSGLGRPPGVWKKWQKRNAGPFFLDNIWTLSPRERLESAEH